MSRRQLWTTYLLENGGGACAGRGRIVYDLPVILTGEMGREPFMGSFSLGRDIGASVIREDDEADLSGWSAGVAIHFYSASKGKRY